MIDLSSTLDTVNVGRDAMMAVQPGMMTNYYLLLLLVAAV